VFELPHHDQGGAFAAGPSMIVKQPNAIADRCYLGSYLEIIRRESDITLNYTRY